MLPAILLSLQQPDFPAQVTDILKTHCQKSNIPGATATILHHGKTIAHVAYGVRRQGDPTPLLPDDPMHLGSVSKTITGFLVALAQEENKLKLDSPAYTFFPDSKPTEETKKITLRHLFSHTSGLKDFKNGLDFKPDFSQPVTAQRRFIAEKAFETDLNTTPGQEFRYDNLNYVILGAVLEKVYNKPWEDLVTERVYKPLNLKTAGFGPTGKLVDGKPTAPYQHKLVNEKLLPVIFDNPVVMGPSATCHMSTADLAKWMQANLDGVLDHSDKLPQSFPRNKDFWQNLHTPAPNTEYGMGFVIGRESTPGIYAFGHSGSNTMSTTSTFADPKTGYVVVVSMNASPTLTVADDALVDIFKLLASLP